MRVKNADSDEPYVARRRNFTATPSKEVSGKSVTGTRSKQPSTITPPRRITARRKRVLVVFLVLLVTIVAITVYQVVAFFNYETRWQTTLANHQREITQQLSKGEYQSALSSAATLKDDYVTLCDSPQPVAALLPAHLKQACQNYKASQLTAVTNLGRKTIVFNEWSQIVQAVNLKSLSSQNELTAEDWREQLQYWQEVVDTVTRVSVSSQATERLKAEAIEIAEATAEAWVSVGAAHDQESYVSLLAAYRELETTLREFESLDAKARQAAGV
ncbi:hypothetical protein FJZ39_01780 [Candidatus Saccharibacteria bacterium]|nr:hypothetical protein [Candidatus Saccharibacteria bacterium]